jgi:two-component system, NtrC family, response regulator AtoC
MQGFTLSEGNLTYLSRFAADIGIAHYLYLLHRENGGILEFIKGGEYSEGKFGLLIKELAEAGSILAYYDLPARESISGVFSTFQARPFKRHVEGLEIHTTLPLTYLSGKRIEKDCYLSRISFIDFRPNIASHGSLHSLFIDLRKSALCGYTSGLFQSLQGRPASPGDILGMPVETLFAPTPEEYQKAMLTGGAPEEKAGWELLYAKDFGQQGLGREEEVPFPAGIIAAPGGLAWSSEADQLSFITLLSSFDTTRQDFSATVAFENLKGKGPVLILGSRYQGPDSQPDNTGYLAGPHLLSDGFTLKRTGFTVLTVPSEGAVPGRETVLQLQKSGRSLHFLVNGRKVLSYFDNDFLGNPQALLTLGLRKGYACVLKKVEIRTAEARNAEMQGPAPRHVIRLKNEQDRYFTLNRFYNSALSLPQFDDIGGFSLSDVTELQDKISLWHGKYETQVKREAQLKNLLKKYEKGGGDFIGTGSSMMLLRDTAKIVAAQIVTVLIQGSTGSGKELLARFIHENSPRSEKPFVKVDCSTVPATLIESHLFGHEKVAFTGAVSRNIGMLEAADRGTLFLDEVGNLTPEAQAKLLQFLNDFTITRIGGTESLRLDVRVIVATNEDLHRRVLSGTFRSDLYYRMNVVSLKLPALKDRQEDIPALCDHFLALTSREAGKRITGFTPQALKKLTAHRWPGNIRELRNAVQRTVIFCNEDYITAEMIELPKDGSGALAGTAWQKGNRRYLALTEKKEVLDLLRKHEGNVSRAAAELGLSRVGLYKFAKQRKIDIRGFRRGFKQKRN